MELLHGWIGDALNAHLSSGRDDDQRGPGVTDPEPPSPKILWAARMTSGTTLMLVDERSGKLICIAPLSSGTVMFGNVQIAAHLVQIGILDRSADAARRALPDVIKDELPPSQTEQLMFDWFVVRAAG